MRTFAQIVRDAGGHTVLARHLGIEPHAVKSWRVRNSIPPGWWHDLILLGVAGAIELIDEAHRLRVEAGPPSPRLKRRPPRKTQVLRVPTTSLGRARLAKGYPTAKAAAEALGIPVATYTQHEQKPATVPRDKAFIYAQAFGITLEQIWAA